MLAISTIVGSCSSAAGFLEYLAATARAAGADIKLVELGRPAIVGYLQALRQTGMTIGGQKKRYDFVKLVLSALASRSEIHIEGGFPVNPFPHSNKRMKSFAAYSVYEKAQIARALRIEVRQALAKSVGELDSYHMACCLIAIALRTGRNETPLLEMEIDALRPHFKPGMKTLVLRKRRTNRDWALPQQNWIEDGGGVLAGTVRIIERVAEQTAPLRSLVETPHANRLWISLSRASASRGKVVPMSAATLRYALKKIADKHDIKDADGSRLAINLKRIRKTFVNRIFEISGQDLITTARATGNTPRVTDTSYLSPDQASQENWRFMGETMARDLAESRGAALTPAGKCNDRFGGEFAPHNGAVCTSFMNCFRCASYVVTSEDLYKIFSLYFAVAAERDRLGKSSWSRVFGNIMRTIDRDIVEAGIKDGILSAAEVQAQRELARVAPHPYWVHGELGGLR
ncbi:hypothetical protein [Pseudoxanthomonas mexicana]|uniref:hypothetical protein n=1 Tax=Pseudoxanthomonas mexicana TaxID=128785 RepID=UPI0028B214CB|nr:hypothetical protein [Pseudoxanthomonas mexicana]